MPEGKNIGVLGDRVESNCLATNFPGISVDINRVDCLAENGDLSVANLLIESLLKQGESSMPDTKGPLGDLGSSTSHP
jgi:hypothetical protein